MQRVQTRTQGRIQGSDPCTCEPGDDPVNVIRVQLPRRVPQNLQFRKPEKP